MLLTASSAYDKDIVDKLERYVADGGKAIVTSGFIKATLGKGIERLTSIRDRGRTLTAKDFASESSFFYNRWERDSCEIPLSFPLLEFRNNSTWGAVCKAVCEEEACTIFALDTYGKGQLYTLVLPEAFSEIKYLPETVLDRIRKEFSVNGIRYSGKGQISIFAYDNDTFVVYPYVDDNTYDSDITVFIKDAKSLISLSGGKEITPLYTENSEAVFRLRAVVGKISGYKIVR